MTMYKTNTPNYMKSFNTFDKDVNDDELKNIKKNKVDNEQETKQIPGNKKLFFNKITKKMNDVSPSEVDDILNSTVEESSNNYNDKFIIRKTKAFKIFEGEVFESMNKLITSLDATTHETNIDSSNEEQMMTIKKVIIETIKRF